MIGLGSNRLTVCRRGGMSVTQAGRGGTEWLAGGRLPSWATPYSAAATAALKDAFSAEQWATIRDYGWEHPEIVGYMNAYAPEDAKIAYSLVPTLGVNRWLVGNTTTYIASGYIAVPTSGVKVISQAVNSSGVNKVIFGCGTGTSKLFYLNYCNNKLEIGANTYSTGLSITAGEIYDLELNYMNSGTCMANGVKQKDITMPNELRELYVFKSNQGYSGNFNGPMKSIIFTEGTTKVREMYPFKRIIDGTEYCGMIDVIYGVFYPDATGNNGFTISETPAS